jgi:hypothetical protein
MDATSLENRLWKAACVIRGPLDALKFKGYILPLVFMKRLSDVFVDEVAHLAGEFGDRDTAARLVEQDHKLVRFYIPPNARWPKIATMTAGLGQFLTDSDSSTFGVSLSSEGSLALLEVEGAQEGSRVVRKTYKHSDPQGSPNHLWFMASVLETVRLVRLARLKGEQEARLNTYFGLKRGDLGALTARTKWSVTV